MKWQSQPAKLGGRARDVLASLVVFLVALPLCMGIAIASGAPVAAGLVTGIIGGLIIGTLAGAPLQVSGPAAGLTVACAEVIGEHGLPAFGIVVALAGIIQVAAGLMHIGQWFRAVSPAVVHGMLSGIGILILSSQLHVMVDDQPRKGGLANLLSIPEAVGKGLPWPTLGNREERQDRLELLQVVGDLHERQREIAAYIERLHTSAGSDDSSLSAAGWRRLETLQRAIALEFEPLTERATRVTSDESSASVQLARERLATAVHGLELRSAGEATHTQKEAVAALSEVLAGLKNHDWAAKLGLATIFIIIAWQSLAPGQLRFLPGPLLAITCVTLLAWWLVLPVLYVEVPMRLWDGLTFPSLSVLKEVPLLLLVKSGIVMALIASAETLLCAGAVDRMHHGPRTQYDRELAAQGLGNFLCGLVGALPMTGVIVRSATNVQAGATSRLSAILHGLWLLIFVVCCANLLRLIPTAALAGILVYTGFRLIDWHFLASHWRKDRVEALIFLATISVIVVEDLLLGVVVGLVLSAAKLLWHFSRLKITLVPDAGETNAGQITVVIAGAATFLRLPILAARLEDIAHDVDVALDLRRLAYVDEACRDVIRQWADDRTAAGQQVSFLRPSNQSY